MRRGRRQLCPGALAGCLSVLLTGWPVFGAPPVLPQPGRPASPVDAGLAGVTNNAGPVPASAARSEEGVCPRGEAFCFTFYSAKDADALFTLTNGATAVGPYYGSQVAPLSNAAAWNTRLVYKVEPPSLAGLGPSDFDAPGFVWPSNETLSNEVAALVTAVRINGSIAIWDVEPEELRPWKSAEMNCLRVIYSAIHANDPSNRPVYMYQPNHRTAEHLAVTMTNQDLCVKGTYVNAVSDGLGNSCMTNRIWARWSMEQIVRACDTANTNATPWIALWMAADPPAGVNRATITNWCRHDAYMGLVMGGKGIHVWSGFRGRSGFSDASFDSYLGGYLSVAKDLNGPLDLGPVFLYGQTMTNACAGIAAGPATQRVIYGGKTNDYPSVTYRSILHNGSNYLFMVNSAEQPVTASFSGLPDADRIDLFDGTRAPTPGGQFSITMPSLAVRAFRFAQGQATGETCTLVVASPRGDVFPGTVTADYGAFIEQWVTHSPVSGGAGTQYVCVGATVAGNDCRQVSPTNVTLTLTNDATLAWQWQTQYWLGAAAGTNGSILGGNEWLPAQATGNVSAVPVRYCHLAGWTGTVEGTENPLAVVMQRPHSVVAVFAVSTTSNGVPWPWLAEHGWTNDFEAAAAGDGDGDGLFAWAEYVAGTDPTNRLSTLEVSAVEAAGVTNLVLRWPSVSNRWYSVMGGTNLPGGFETLPGASNLPATPSVNSYTGALLQSAPIFYRLGVRRE